MWLFHGCDPSLTFLMVKGNSGDPGKESRQRVGATATAGPGPADVDESMLSALLAATHDAAMECYRLGTIPGQKPEGRRESLSQASELARSCACWSRRSTATRPGRGAGGHDRVNPR